jgi:isopenicillin N synthase-like dioxygenase
MEFISGGFYKATIHRVVQPPEDQRGYTRLGIFYFANPNNDMVLETVAGSPVLEKLGVRRSFINDKAPTAGEWLKGRIAAYGKTQLKKSQQQDNVEEEILNGAVVRHYN